MMERLPFVLLQLVIFILSVTVHEYAHALAATKLGDDIPEREGRLTLSPAAHVDPVGTLLFPVIGGLFGIPLIAWGRPVNTVPRNYTRKVTLRGGLALVSFAGPASNFLLSVVSLGLLVSFLRFGVLDHASPFTSMLSFLGQANLGLFIFNLIPVPPADGSKIVSWIFGMKADRPLDALAELGPLPIYAAMFLGGSAIGYATRWLYEVIQGAFVHLLF